MDDVKVESQDSSTPAGEGAADQDAKAEETAGSSEELETLRAANEKLQSEKDELHGRATRAEAELKRSKPNPAGSGQPAPSSDAERRIEEKVDLRLSGYSKEEIDEIAAFAKAKGIGSLTEAAKLPIVQHAINGLRADAKAKEATPPSTKRAGASGGERSKMSPQEKAKDRSFETWQQRRRQTGGR